MFRTVAVFYTVFLFPCLCVGADLNDSLRQMTGSDSVRMVWCRNGSGNFAFPATASGYTEDQTLIGYNSETGQEHVICSKPSNYQNPLITRDGRHVVYSNCWDEKVYMVAWDGQSEPVEIADGVGGCLWYDQENCTEWVLYNKGYEIYSRRTKIYRVNLKNTEEDSLVYQNNDIPCSVHWLSVSADLQRLGSVWQHPGVSTVDRSGGQHILSSGCWTSMPYDNTYRLVLLNTDHTAIKVYEEGGTGSLLAEIAVGTMNHMKIATYHINIVCLAKGMADEGSNMGGYLHVLQLNTDLTEIVADVQVNKEPKDGFPDLWSSSVLASVSDCITGMPHQSPTFNSLSVNPPQTARKAFSPLGRCIQGGATRLERGIIVVTRDNTAPRLELVLP